MKVVLGLPMISKEEVQHIAKLARLELTEKETEKMQKDLSSILDYFNVLKSVKTSTSKVKSQNHKSKVKNPNTTRKDEAGERSASLANNLVEQTPDKKDGYVKVKAIL